MKRESNPPSVYIIAGPNGAGKTTFACKFLPNYADCYEFVNADLIAGGLSPFAAEAATIQAGRLLLDRIHNIDLALERIADRVRQGGHNVPDDIVRRRFHKGLRNFFRLYRPLSDTWMIFDNSIETPRLIAAKDSGEITIIDKEMFSTISNYTEEL